MRAPCSRRTELIHALIFCLCVTFRSGFKGSYSGIQPCPTQPQEPAEQQLLEPQHEVEVQLLDPLVAPVSGTATASRTLITSMSSKSRSGRSMSSVVE